jgi:hypothetical protein
MEIREHFFMLLQEDRGHFTHNNTNPFFFRSRVLPLLLPPTNNAMVQADTAPPHLHIASCYEGSEDSSSEIMKRPLITTAWSSSNASAEEQTRLVEKDKRQGKEGSLAWRAFLLGGVLQVMAFATYYTSTIFKIWGQDPTFSGSLSLVFYWILFLLSRVDIAIYFGLWLTFLYTISSKSGSLYMRKKLDQDVDTPAGSNWYWTARMLFIVGISLGWGAIVGCFLCWTIVHLHMSVPFPFTALMAVVYNFVLCLIMIKYFLDWMHNRSGQEEQEEEEEEDEFLFL